nr:hemerythrin domain-containing protein [Abyssogena phaseoliformis symbiont]
MLLSLANKCVNTAKSNNASNVKDLCLQISKTFKSTFSENFETEELTIFMPLKHKSGSLFKLCNQLIDEHQQLYQLAQDLPNHPECLLAFGNLLKSHSRLEDRQLFPKIDLLSNSEKLAIIKLSSCHTSPMLKI